MNSYISERFDHIGPSKGLFYLLRLLLFQSGMGIAVETLDIFNTIISNK